MDDQDFYFSTYDGSKNYTDWQVNMSPASGFGAAPDNYAEHGIDLNEQLVRNKPATYFMRVNSSAMTGAGIHSGDVVIVDRSLEPKNGKVVIAVLDGELLIRFYEVQNGRLRLVPATASLAPIDVDRTAQFFVWGVVTYVIHMV